MSANISTYKSTSRPSKEDTEIPSKKHSSVSSLCSDYTTLSFQPTLLILCFGPHKTSVASLMSANVYNCHLVPFIEREQPLLRVEARRWSVHPDEDCGSLTLLQATAALRVTFNHCSGRQGSTAQMLR